MRRSVYQRTGFLTVAFIAAFVLPTSTYAADGPAGNWDLMISTQPTALDISEKDGAYSGTLAPPDGVRELSEIEFEDGTLTFKIVVEEAGMTLDFSAIIDGDSMSGTLSIPDSGIEMSVTGTRGGAAPTIVGTWKLMVDSQLGNNPRDLVVNEDLSGTYGGGDFDSFDIDDLKVDGNSVEFDVTLSVQGQELPSHVTLTLDGNKVSGELDFGDGTASIVGEKVVATIVGKWKLMVESQLGNNPRNLVVNDDLSGTYGGGDFDELEITNLTVNGNKIEFNVTLSIQGQELPAHATLMLDGNTISGELATGQGSATVVGEKDAS